MSPSTTRLTETVQGIKARGICQKCGAPEATAWCEHDHNDNPEYKFLWLCKRCSDKLIEPHPRLYKEFGKHEPLPGGMPICDDCPWRKEIICTNMDAKVHGGPGLKMVYPSPSTAFVDGPKFSGRITLFHGPVTACSGKDT